MKLYLNKLRLKWKIFAFLLGFCALLLIILWLFQTVLLDSFYRSIKVIEIKNSAGSIEKNIDNNKLSDLITSISQNNDVSIEVMTESGQVLYSAEAQRESMVHKMSVQNKLKLISSAKEQNGEFFKYLSDTPAAPRNRIDEFIGKLPVGCFSAESIAHLREDRKRDVKRNSSDPYELCNFSC